MHEKDWIVFLLGVSFSWQVSGILHRNVRSVRVIAHQNMTGTALYYIPLYRINLHLLIGILL